MPDTGIIGPCAPFLIVSDLARSLDHYVGGLGFDCPVRAPPDDPFFAIVERGTARILLKTIAPDVPPTPNPRHHAWARWDAFVAASDPVALAGEFASRNVVVHWPAENADDGLVGFEVADPDGYVLYFGRPA